MLSSHCAELSLCCALTVLSSHCAVLPLCCALTVLYSHFVVLQPQATINSTSRTLVALPLQFQLNMTMALSDVSAKLELLAAVNKELSSVSDPFSKGPAYLAQTVVALNVTKVNFNVSQVQVRPAVLSLPGLLLLPLNLPVSACSCLCFCLCFSTHSTGEPSCRSHAGLLFCRCPVFSPCLYLFFCSIPLCACSHVRLRLLFLPHVLDHSRNQ